MPAIIDPPEGWRYGFPKPVPEGVDRDEFLANLAVWLVANGYPQEMVDLFDGNVRCRIIGDF
jgi:hypothetical protein